MLVLAVDTALHACSACILDAASGRVLARETKPMATGHAEALLPLMQRVMREAGVEARQLGRIVSTVGPGSFTGLRIGLSAARAVALVADVPCVGVTTLTALAAPLLEQDATSSVAVALDARHAHVYFQAFAPDGTSFVAPCVIPVEDAARALAGRAVRLVGSGAPLIATAWQHPEAPRLVDQQPAPDILAVARLGAVADPAHSLPEPLYLRPPDVKPQTGGRIARR